MPFSRRSFLGGASAAAGSLALSPSAVTAAPGDIRLGIASYSFREFSRGLAIKMTRKLGVNFINIKEFHLLYKSTPEERARGRQQFENAGLTITGGGTVYMVKNDPADVDFYFQYARDCGMPLMVIGATTETLPLIEKAVQKYNIKVAVHNHGPEDKWFPRPSDALKAIKNMDPRVGLCVDVGHTTRMGADILEEIEAAGPRLLDLHIKDLRDLKDGKTQVPVGEGSMPIPKIFRLLKKMNYTGAVMLEYEIEMDDPFLGMSKSFSYMRGVLAGMAS